MNIQEFFHQSHNGEDWTRAFQEAAETLNARGGGELYVPAGVYMTGSIRLYSHTTLRLENGAYIRFIQNEAMYPLIDLEFEGIHGKVFRPCLYAENAEYVKLTGDGALDGQGAYWWNQVRAGTLKHPRPYLVCFADCKHVTIENVLLTNSPVWTVHPLRCRDVTIRGLRIQNPADSPNTDGIDPDACQDVRILDTTIDVGDDCIAIKSGTEDTANRQACERILIANCHFLHGHGGVVIGSEMSGGVRNVCVSNCVFYKTDRGVRLKTRRGRGGVVEGIQLSGLIMESVMCAFVFNMYYFCGKDGKMKRVWDKDPYPVDESTPKLKDVTIVNVTCRKCAACAGYFYGLAEMPIQGVTMRNVVVEMDADGLAGQPAMMDGCPPMKGAGFYMRNAIDVTFEGVQVKNARGEAFDRDESVALNPSM